MNHLGMIAAYAASILYAGSAAAQEQQSYAYDVHGRLVSVHRDGPTASLVTGYGLDGADNRTNRASIPTTTEVWEAEALPHVIGFAEADGWAANVTQPEGHMTYGPYTNSVPAGSRVAVWRMMVDSVDVAGSAPAIRLDVYDATAGQVLASIDLHHASWRTPWTYQWFELPFTMDASRAGHHMEFRTYFYPIAHVRVDKVSYR